MMNERGRIVNLELSLRTPIGSNVPSYIENYISQSQREWVLDSDVLESLLRGIEPDNLVEAVNRTKALFVMFGININNREQVYSEVVNLLDSMFTESHTRLPEAYDLTCFSDQFFGYDDVVSLTESFADCFFFSFDSHTWFDGVLPVVREFWAAEISENSPVPVDSPSSPILEGLETPSLLELPPVPNGENGGLESPLDQFAIHPIIDFHIGNFYISFTNQSLFTLLTVVFVVVGFFLVTKKGGGKLVPNAWQSLVEQIYDFVLNLVNEQIGGNMKQKFFPCILVTFTFLLFCNLQGMIPFSFTVTSHFLITLALSFSIFIGITIVGFQRHGLHFLSFLLPAGVPLPLAPFLVLLELISYCFRALSLGIRLFANMMAGHSLVKILSGFAWTMLFLNNIFYFIGDLGPLFIVLALTGLELGVAILQAYVFTILICIYLNDAINLH